MNDIPVVENLSAVPETIDIVDIFRRRIFASSCRRFLKTDAKFLNSLAYAVKKRKKCLQAQGRNDIVMDRCVKIELNKKSND